MEVVMENSQNLSSYSPCAIVLGAYSGVFYQTASQYTYPVSLYSTCACCWSGTCNAKWLEIMILLLCCGAFSTCQYVTVLLQYCSIPLGFLPLCVCIWTSLWWGSFTRHYILDGSIWQTVLVSEQRCVHHSFSGSIHLSIGLLAPLHYLWGTHSALFWKFEGTEMYGTCVLPLDLLSDIRSMLPCIPGRSCAHASAEYLWTKKKTSIGCIVIFVSFLIKLNHFLLWSRSC